MRIRSMSAWRRYDSGVMRTLLILAFVAIPVSAQNPVATISNTTRPGSADFQVGDRFEVVITGAANQPISVRTTRVPNRTDWGPVIDRTDARGRWSTRGQFEKADFGPWSEAWTVGGKLANPVVSFSVTGPCLSGGRGMTWVSGSHVAESCQTAAGEQTFATPSDSDSFRTPDGREVPGRMQPGLDMASLIEDTANGAAAHSGEHGDDAAALITKLIGANALSDGEIRNVLWIVRAAFQNRNVVPPTANPATLLLLQHLASEAERENLKQEIFQTIDFVRTQ